MKKILFIAVILLVAGCSKEDKSVEQQDKTMLNFLTSGNIAYVNQGGVYKVTTFTNAVTNAPVIEKGDSAYIYFAGFPYAGATLTNPFTTNMEEVADIAMMDKTLLNFNAKGLKVGNVELIKGIDLGLIGSQAGDSVILLINSNLAYGLKGRGVVKSSQPVTFSIVIDKIIK